MKRPELDRPDRSPEIEAIIRGAYARANRPVALRRSGGTPVRWLEVDTHEVSLPLQGWKLHVSARTDNAVDVLRAALGVLAPSAAAWKTVDSIGALARLNAGAGGDSQVGKFITIYPVDDDQLLELADTLHAATAGLTGPPVPTDRSVRPGSLVHTRYGGFGHLAMVQRNGAPVTALIDPEGRLVPEVRGHRFSPPPWAVDPFAGQAADARGAPADHTRSMIDGRWLLLGLLTRSARGDVHSGVDIALGRRCVVKIAAADQAVGDDGRDACARRLHEAAVLDELVGIEGIPERFGLVSTDTGAALAIELIDGTNLASLILERWGSADPLDADEVVAIAAPLARTLCAVHGRGLVHCDLKAANVVLDPAGRPWLIDFEETMAPGTEGLGRSAGTPGSMSPQRYRGEPVDPADDIYSFGTLLLFLATGAPPWAGPDDAVLHRPPRLLAPGADPAIIDLATRCLAPDASARPTIDELVAALDRLTDPTVTTVTTLTTGSIPSSGSRTRRAAAPEATDSPRAATTEPVDAAEAVARLIAMAETVDGGSALHWRTRRLTSAGTALRGIHSGTAGAVLALAEAVRLGIDGHAATALHRGADALRDGLGNRPDDGVGLLGGEPGVAVALGRAARALGDMDLLEVASEQLLGLEAWHDTNADLASGAAGIVLAHLEFADLASGPDHLGRAVTFAHRLVDRASVGDDGTRRWTSPGADHTDAAIVRPGLQFGTAGVLLALVRLAAVSGDARWRRAAAAAGQGLLADIHGGAAHPGDTARSRTWRNERGVGDHTFADGGAGIAMALGRVDRLLAEHGEPAVSPATDRASLLPLFVAARAAGPTLMHGLAGTIVALVDLHSTTGDVAYLDEAHSHSLLLGTWRNATASGVWWGRGDPSPDLATGTAGIVLASCRLAAARLARSATTMPLR